MVASEVPTVAQKRATVSREGGARFRARTGSGHELILDNASGDAGPRPVELLLVALAGCTAMDVISILEKKRQAVTWYEVQVEAEQREASPRVFTRVDVVHLIEGRNVDERAVRRAIELSATRYCTANATLSAGVTAVRHSYRIRQTDGGDGELAGDVVTTGPHADPDLQGARSPSIGDSPSTSGQPIPPRWWPRDDPESPVCRWTSAPELGENARRNAGSTRPSTVSPSALPSEPGRGQDGADLERSRAACPRHIPVRFRAIAGVRRFVKFGC